MLQTEKNSKSFIQFSDAFFFNVLICADAFFKSPDNYTMIFIFKVSLDYVLKWHLFVPYS